MYAKLVHGGQLYIEETDDFVKLAEGIDERCYGSRPGGQVVVFEVHEDIDGSPTYTLTFYGNDENRLIRIKQVQRAFTAAEEALVAASYVNASDYLERETV